MVTTQRPTRQEMLFLRAQSSTALWFISLKPFISISNKAILRVLVSNMPGMQHINFTLLRFCCRSSTPIRGLSHFVCGWCVLTDYLWWCQWVGPDPDGHHRIIRLLSAYSNTDWHKQCPPQSTLTYRRRWPSVKQALPLLKYLTIAKLSVGYQHRNLERINVLRGTVSSVSDISHTSWDGWQIRLASNLHSSFANTFTTSRRWNCADGEICLHANWPIIRWLSAEAPCAKWTWASSHGTGLSYKSKWCRSDGISQGTSSC